MRSLNILSLFLYLGLSSTAQADCDIMKASPQVQKIAEGIVNLAQSGSHIWPTYSLATTPLVLIDSKQFPTCVVVIKEGNVSAHAKPAEFPAIKNTVYEFCGGHEFFTACPKSETLPPLESGLLFELTNVMQSVLPQIGFDIHALNFVVLAHEGFHFIGQSVSSIKLGWWKELKTLSGASSTRDAISKQCYLPSPEAEALTRQELKLLQKMVKETFDNASIAEVKKTGQEFLSVRQKRYDLLKDTVINDRDGVFTCQQAEVAMEFSEGLAEFVGLQSGLDSKMMSPQNVQDWIDLSLQSDLANAELFYKTGAMVLLTMKNADDIAYQDLVTAIITAKSLDQTIMHEFAKWIEQ